MAPPRVKASTAGYPLRVAEPLTPDAWASTCAPEFSRPGVCHGSSSHLFVPCPSTKPKTSATVSRTC
ncbi:unnamed protein product [Sphenostylis stenocarpa]|uniref:Uncharacterized protein n=1 Tax=Sphenostylis stenocarpa TaxID=92480 RepID=A0AA86VSW7_9FABA|nr:unnamed protein product [Sphenostylis stenocarpa]